jgi:cytochrome c oxidase accessory protein FixG
MARQLPVLNSAPGSSALRPDGGRTFVVPADVHGIYTRRKYALFALLSVVYAVLPWVQIRGRPALYLDLERRAFYLFGATFNAQDFWITFFVLSGLGFALIVVTTLWGRVWCGYACPQTVFIEGVYRRVERLLEGPRNVRLKREHGPWTLGRTVRKVAKHGAFLLISFVVAHILLSYFVSLPALLQIMRQSPSENPEAFAWALGTTMLMYGNFAWFREQFCIILCPYGRMQSVLIDDDTTTVGYDQIRGEPRGKATQKDKGDCIDCGRCVVVCPTGIDIRNGLQLECIGCAACADACDEVMLKVNRPKGLIRYDSHNGFSHVARRLWRPRLYVYAALGAAGLAVATFALAGRAPFEANLLRLAGPPFMRAENQVRNAVELHLINKRSQAATFTLQGDPGLTYLQPSHAYTLPSLGERRIPILVSAPDDHLPRIIRIRIRNGETQRTVEAKFIAP